MVGTPSTRRCGDPIAKPSQIQGFGAILKKGGAIVLCVMDGPAAGEGEGRVVLDVLAHGLQVSHDGAEGRTDVVGGPEAGRMV